MVRVTLFLAALLTASDRLVVARDSCQEGRSDEIDREITKMFELHLGSRFTANQRSTLASLIAVELEASAGSERQKSILRHLNSFLKQTWHYYAYAVVAKRTGPDGTDDLPISYRLFSVHLRDLTQNVAQDPARELRDLPQGRRQVNALVKTVAQALGNRIHDLHMDELLASKVEDLKHTLLQRVENPYWGYLTPPLTTSQLEELQEIVVAKILAEKIPPGFGRGTPLQVDFMLDEIIQPALMSIEFYLTPRIAYTWSQEFRELKLQFDIQFQQHMEQERLATEGLGDPAEWRAADSGKSPEDGTAVKPAAPKGAADSETPGENEKAPQARSASGPAIVAVGILVLAALLLVAFLVRRGVRSGGK